MKRAFAATLMLLAAVALQACGGNDRKIGAPAPAGPFAVGVRVITLVDTTRPTDANGEIPARPERTFITRVYYPATGEPGGDEQLDAAPATGDGPFPLVVFAHGLGAVAEVYRDLYRAWAEAGYVVVAPNFPLSSALPEGPAVGGDYVNQPADVSFVIDRMLDLGAADSGSTFTRLIDGERIAAGGQSLGGMTTVGVAFNTCCIDPRIDVAFPMAAVMAPFPGGTFDFGLVDTPVLVIHGDADDVVPYERGREIYAQAQPPKFLVTILGGDHIIPYVAGPSRAETEPAREAPIAFLDYHLKGRRGALDELLAIDDLAVARVESTLE